MSKCKLLVFTTDDDFGRMLKTYFEPKDFIVKVSILNSEWSQHHIIEICKQESPDALIIWERGSKEMLSLYETLKSDEKTTTIAIALIMVAYPGWLAEIPDYLFVHPFQIDKVEAIINKGCNKIAK